MKHRLFCLVLLMALAPVHPAFSAGYASAHSAGDLPSVPVPSGDDISFIENKGQWQSFIRYAAQLPSGWLYLTDQGFTYSFVHQEDIQLLHASSCSRGGFSETPVRGHAYKLHFRGKAGHELKWEEADKRSYYYNYFLGNDSARWAGGVSLYGRVSGIELYPGIDLVVYSAEGALKYDLVINPGADPNAVMFEFEGVNPQLTPAGDLLITTSVNRVIEKAPYSYQVIGRDTISVPGRYLLKGQMLQFVFPEGYDKNYPLVIDPSLVMATYSGIGREGGLAYASTYDQRGCLYTSTAKYTGGNYPVTTGAFQTVYKSQDMGISKFSPNGDSLIYATFYGGNRQDAIVSMIVNSRQELICAGTTKSSDLPLSPQHYAGNLNGTDDLFVVRFNDSGSRLIGATYVGGSGTELIPHAELGKDTNNRPVYEMPYFTCDVYLDNDEHIWVGGQTQSADFPVTSDAFQPVFGGGNTDGVLFRLNPECTQLEYSTFVGGDNFDFTSRIALDGDGNILLTGVTLSQNFTTTTGSLHPSFLGGLSDGFLVNVHVQTGDLLYSTFLGTDSADAAYSSGIDQNDDVYVMGRSRGAMPVSSGVFHIPDGDVFIQKISSDLTTRLLSTRVGNPSSGAHYFQPDGFMVDSCGNIYVAGLSADSTLPVTRDAYRATPGFFWFCVLEPDFSRLGYASYFSGERDGHSHQCVQRLDPSGTLYFTYCGNDSTFPATPDVVFPYKQTSGVENLSFKFDFQFFGPKASFRPADGFNDTGCAPYRLALENTSASADYFIWDFGDGTPRDTGITPPVHEYILPGVYTITLYAHRNGSCITDDTAYMEITVLDVAPPQISVSDTLVCHYSTSLDVGVAVHNTGYHYKIRWGPSAGILGGDSQAVISVDPAVNNIYYVVVTDTVPGICAVSVSDTVHIAYKPRMLSLYPADTVVCAGAGILVRAAFNNDYAYQWMPAEGVSNDRIPDPLLTIDSAVIYTVTGRYPGCPDTIVQIAIGVEAFPQVDLGSDTGVCKDEALTITPVVTPLRTDYKYIWYYGQKPLNVTESNIRTWIPVADGIYYLEVISPAGCVGGDSIGLTVYPYPLVFLGDDTSICPGDAPFILKNREAQYLSDQYRWSTGEQTAAISVQEPGIYWLQVISEHGCKVTDSVKIHRSCYIDLPNVFTPNGDGINDYFFPHGLLNRGVTGFHMQVFNRWGQLVYESRSLNDGGWDGRLSGAPAPEGVYVYQVSAKVRNGSTETQAGNVTLLR